MTISSKRNQQDAKQEIRIFKLVSVMASLLLLCSYVIASESSADTELPPEERWFEVEVILYKSTSDKGLVDESWDKDTLFNLPEKYADFLNPLEEPSIDELQDIAEISEVGQVGATTEPLSNSAIDNEGTEVDVEAVELPFQKLSDDYLQLKNEAKRISVNPNFRLLNHFAWRQPVSNKSDATPVRLAGGHDYHELFDYSGSKKLPPIVVPEEALDAFSDSYNPTTGISVEESSSETEVQTGETLLSEIELEENFEPKLLPWVPELDGSAIVYIYRNFLHFDTKVFYRNIGREEVDFLKLNNLTTINAFNSTLSLDELLDDKSQLAPLPPTQENELTWHYDDSFLNQDAEKVYTERLFNYPLIQTRRMRSTELHYFDHPLIGILVMIRPYEIEQDLINSEK